MANRKEFYLAITLILLWLSTMSVLRTDRQTREFDFSTCTFQGGVFPATWSNDHGLRPSDKEAVGRVCATHKGTLCFDVSEQWQIFTVLPNAICVRRSALTGFPLHFSA